MDPRLKRLKPGYNAATSNVPASPEDDASVDPKSDASHHTINRPTSDESSRTTDVPSAPAEDSASLENAFLDLSCKSGNTSVQRSKQTFWQEQSKAASEKYARDQQRLAQFPRVLEMLQNDRNKANACLEEATKNLHDATAVEARAARDLVRLLLDLVRHDNRPVKILEAQVESLKKENQHLRSEQTATASLIREVKVQLDTLSRENGTLDEKLRNTGDVLDNARSQQSSDTKALGDSLASLKQEYQEQIPRIDQSIEPLTHLPATVQQLQNDLQLDKEASSQALKDLQVNLHNLQSLVSRKGSQLSIKGIESEIQTIKNNLEATTQTNSKLSEDMKTLKDDVTTSSKVKEYVSAQAFDLVTQDLIDNMATLRHELSEQIGKLRDQHPGQTPSLEGNEQLQALRDTIGKQTLDIDELRKDVSASKARMGRAVSQDEPTGPGIDSRSTTSQFIELRQQIAELEATVLSVKDQHRNSDGADLPARRSSPDSQPQLSTDTSEPLPSLNARIATPGRTEHVENQDEPATKTRQSENTVTQPPPHLLQDLKQEITAHVEQSLIVIMGDIERIEREMKEELEQLRRALPAPKCAAPPPPITDALSVEAHKSSTPASIDEQDIKALRDQMDALQAQVSSLGDTAKGHIPIVNGVERAQPSESSAGISRRQPSTELDLEHQRSEIQKLDKALATLMAAQMSTDDREALSMARSLWNRLEKQEHQHQWLRTRMDNLTTESLHRQIVGYVAPVLPKLEQGLKMLQPGITNFEMQTKQISAQVDSFILSTGARMQATEDNLNQLSSEQQQKHDILATEFGRTRDDVLAQIKSLASAHGEYDSLKTKIQDIVELKAELKKLKQEHMAPHDLNGDSSSSRTPLSRGDRRALSARSITRPTIDSTPKQLARGQQISSRKKSIKEIWPNSDSNSEGSGEDGSSEEPGNGSQASALLEKFKMTSKEPVKPHSSEVPKSNIRQAGDQIDTPKKRKRHVPSTSSQTQSDVERGQSVSRKRRQLKSNASPE